MNIIYDNTVLADIICDEPRNWDFGSATVARVCMPTESNAEVTMQRMGFIFADRTIKATITLDKCPLNTERYIRLPIVETTKYKDDIFQIAVNSFTYDRRFHILPVLSTTIASTVLKTWVYSLDKTLVALYHDRPIGFLALLETAKDTIFIHLAAVEAKYRLTGAAMALYTYAIRVAQERGYKRIEGRISTQNFAVMNIYSSFGATFSLPEDIFLKDLKNGIS